MHELQVDTKGKRKAVQQKKGLSGQEKVLQEMQIHTHILNKIK